MPTYSSHPTPIFSVIITCYNDGLFLEEAINSVLNSTYKLFEIIIVDDCSTDTITINKLNTLESSGFNIIRKKSNAGVGNSRNRGIENANGTFILTLDADDRIHPHYLEKSLTHLQKGVDVVYCDVKRFGLSDLTHISPAFSFQKLLTGNFISNCSPFTKEIWKKSGGFDSTMVGYEDWDFWICVAEAGAIFYHINEVLFEYRAKENSLNSKCSDPDYRAKMVKYVCEKHLASYQKYATEIIPDLHRIISTFEEQSTQFAARNKSLTQKLKNAVFKFSKK